jgi:mono/diheme cytochrome c family protein
MRWRVDYWVALIGIAGLAASSGCIAASAVDINAGSYAQQTGEELYRGICQGCHMPDAQGAIGAGAYPALANNKRLIARVYPMSVVINGQRAMPAFGADLSDEQIANVINYVRTHFGNHYKDAVTAASVKAVRR